MSVHLVYSDIPYRVSNPDQWEASDMLEYVGDTLLLQDKWYLTDNRYFKFATYSISPHRIFSPTNMVLPGTAAYTQLVSHNHSASIRLKGESAYHRCGELLSSARVRVEENGTLTWIDGEWQGNTREDILQGLDSADIDRRAKHTLLVCAANLEYYLVKTLDGDMGPDGAEEHARQRKKVSEALARIGADIYGFVEVERGQYALAELSEDLTRLTGRPYTYINDGGSVYGSYTKSGYVYCSQSVKPYASLRINNVGVSYRKYMQCFEDSASGERFIFSLNHFKAKSGQGTGDNADKGDGQGSYNADRVKEAESVLEEYDYYHNFTREEDLLVMGDLNAYAMEDPIRVFTASGMTDLHRYFHADSSYSYRYYDGSVGYLDHAICNATMLQQVTGMVAYHINSDENDCYTYDGPCYDSTMFRYSDHDPIVVGLRLQPYDARITDIVCVQDLLFADGYAQVKNADGGHLLIHSMAGWFVGEYEVTGSTYSIPLSGLPSGIYILHLYFNNQVLQRKLIVP